MTDDIDIPDDEPLPGKAEPEPGTETEMPGIYEDDPNVIEQPITEPRED